MKIKILLTMLAVMAIITSCSNSDERNPRNSSTVDESSVIQEKIEVTNPQITKFITPYMENAYWVDITTEDAFKNQLDMDLSLFSEVALYSGKDLKNTTYFFMGALNNAEDISTVKNKLETIIEGIISSQDTGSISGNTQYSIIEKDNRIFAVMHEDEEMYIEIIEFLNEI